MNFANATELPKAILVAGMHRSGTSAITRILNLLGLALPGNLMPASSKFNPTGFWESKDVVAINDHLLAGAASHWDEMFEFDIGALTPATLSKFHADVSQLLEGGLASEECFVIKDPRIARTLPLWLEAFRRCQHDVKIIIPVRHPLEVTASLARRDAFSVDKSVYLWLRYMLDSIRYSVDDGYGIVVYEELIQDWRASIERLRQELQITWPIDVVTATPAINKFINRDLRHHELSAINWESEGHSFNPIADLATQLHDALVSRAPDLILRANEIHKQLAALETIFLPLLADYRRQRQVDLKQQDELNHTLVRVVNNVNDLERTLSEERNVYKNLDTEFNIKCSHILLLQDEISALKQRFDGLKANNTTSDADKLDILKVQVQLSSQLQEIEFLVREKQGELFSMHQAMQSQQRQFRDEITRAEAQLNLLKDLFLDKL